MLKKTYHVSMIFQQLHGCGTQISSSASKKN